MNLSQKELQGLQELLDSERLLVKKYELFAQNAGEEPLRARFEQIAVAHRGHYERLRSRLAQE